ncbi:MAG: RdgB/HAM1 family non-canonical purine NTP pyrophosphatase [Synergistaceae bacterium]|nr:RdgB/HAM1 family non-canonical purine NTP pyrophosphatase [Synergistota bacterium]NLM71505.1 RdgB/HAM1 family non-canonical purine NTP pyrophosphatase [Synergistaceae bacterium]
MKAPIDRVLFASGNRGKYDEAAMLFAPFGVELLFGPDVLMLEVDESGVSYHVNAWLKARAYSNATGMASLADDSGLEIYALDGAPGLLSARLAPSNEERIELVLDRLKGISDRSASFIASLALYLPSGACVITEGICRGEITEAPSGELGFGYDPIFRPLGCGRTFGQMTERAKRAISHRALASFRLLGILFG